MAITIVGQFLLVQFAGSFASTTPLHINQWLISVGIGAITLPYGTLKKKNIKKKEREKDTNNKEHYITK